MSRISCCPRCQTALALFCALIFFSTLGGLLLFGPMGFILGPILAALFVTVWEMFGIAFRTAIAEPGSPASLK